MKGEMTSEEMEIIWKCEIFSKYHLRYMLHETDLDDCCNQGLFSSDTWIISFLVDMIRNVISKYMKGEPGGQGEGRSSMMSGFIF